MRWFAKILVYGLLLPAILFFCVLGIKTGDYLKVGELLLYMTPVVLGGLACAHGRAEQLLSSDLSWRSLWRLLTGNKRLETPEEVRKRIWAGKDRDMLRYAQGILDQDEEVLYQARIHWEGENDRIKWAVPAAFLGMVTLPFLPFPRGSAAHALLPTAVVACVLFMLLGAPLWWAWASNIMRGCGCVVTNRRIIVRHNVYRPPGRNSHAVSIIPLDRAREVVVRQRRWERKTDTGSVRVRCASAADIVRLVRCQKGDEWFVCQKRTRFWHSALSLPLRHVREPLALKRFIESWNGVPPTVQNQDNQAISLSKKTT